MWSEDVKTEGDYHDRYTLKQFIHDINVADLGDPAYNLAHNRVNAIIL